MTGFQNLLAPKNIQSGIGDYIWVAPVSWFAPNGIKTPTPPFENPGDSVIITEDHEFLDGKGFVKMQCAPRKNKLELKTIGDLGLNKFENQLEVFLPGSYIELHEQAKNLINIPLIVLCFDCDCPIEYMYNLGCDCVSCWMTLDFSTGYTHEGNKGYKGLIQTTSNSVYFYEGMVTLTDVQEFFLLGEDGAPILTESENPITVN